MATPHTNHHHLATFLIVSLLLVSSSSARPLKLALPSDRVVAPPAEELTRHVLACGHKRVFEKLPLTVTRLGGRKYGSLVLNMLPKGPVPPSGPSKGTNNLNN